MENKHIDQLLSDGLKFITSTLPQDVLPVRTALLCANIDVPVDNPTTDDVVTVENILASHLLEGSFHWSALPPSWSNSKSLALLCVSKSLTPSTEVVVFQWKDLPEILQLDVDVTKTAILNHFIKDYDDIPTQLRNNFDILFEAWKTFLRWNVEYYTNLETSLPMLNASFFRTCIEQEKIDDWDDLPQEYRENVDFARSIKYFPSKSLAYSILDKFPEICEEQNIWKRLFNSEPIGMYMRNLIELFAPDDIISDKDLMLSACRFDGVLQSIDLSLIQNEIFLSDVLHLYPYQLIYLDHNTQRLYPELVISCLRLYTKDTHYNIIQKLVVRLHPTFWTERENVTTWFAAGLPHPRVMHEDILFTDDWIDDEELLFLVAKHCNAKLKNESFLLLSSTLRSSKEFMRNILALDPNLFACASPDLMTDFDLALIAFSTSPDLVYEFMNWQLPFDAIGFVDLFFATVERKLWIHHIFVHVIQSGFAQPNCPLNIFGQDNETAFSFRTIIAEYLDVPSGQELQLLRQSDALQDRINTKK